MIEFLKRLKTFTLSPMPVLSPAEVFNSAIKLLILFVIFYFAAFNYFDPLAEIYRGLLEFVFVSISMFCSFIIFGLTFSALSQSIHKKRLAIYGFSFLGFFFIYSLGMGFIYIIKQSYYGIEKSWFPRYYWRHLPYAFLFFSVFIYRQYKNSIVDNLFNRLIKELENSSFQTDKTVESNPKETPLELQIDGLTRNILPSQVSHISVDGHYLDIFYQNEGNSEMVSIRKPLQEILNDLPKDKFVRIHRSHIVNLNFIEKLRKIRRKYTVELSNKKYSLPISRNNLPNVLSRIESNI